MRCDVIKSEALAWDQQACQRSPWFGCCASQARLSDHWQAMLRATRERTALRTHLLDYTTEFRQSIPLKSNPTQTILWLAKYQVSDPKTIDPSWRICGAGDGWAWDSQHRG